MALLKRLFEPFSIHSLELKNRIVMPAMATNYANSGGEVTDRLVSYYEQRAKGGAGLIIVEVACVDFPRGKTILNQLAVHDDYCVKGLMQLVTAVKRWGPKIALQLHHAGRRAMSKNTGMSPVAPSPIACYGGELPVELDKSGIKSIIEAFAEGARRAKDAGFDAVELHCAHGYLINQFLSPLTNKRSDEYGGNLSNRLTFVRETLTAIRERVGEEYPLLARISADEFIPGGLKISDSVKIAQALQATGIHCIHVSAGSTASSLEEYDAQEMTSIPSMFFKGPCFSHLAEKIRKAVKLPIITVGRINDPLVGETILNEGKADLIAMGRAFITDPEFPKKAEGDKFDDIRKCIACLYCIDVVLNQRRPLSCAINPLVGNEGQPPAKSKATKKILIIGGGPAGMEAARWGSLRGHNVTLWERSSRLGGQLNLAMIPPHKEGLKSIIDFLLKQLRILNITVELEKEANASLVRKFKPDVLILATGAKPTIHDDLKLINNVYTANEILEDIENARGNIVVIGAGLVGCEVAAWLGEHGKKVTIIETLPEIASEVNPFIKKSIISALNKKGVLLRCEIKDFEIKDNELYVYFEKQEKWILNWDTIVACTGYEPDRTLFELLKNEEFETFIIGDCVRPEGINEAIHEAFEIVTKI